MNERSRVEARPRAEAPGPAASGLAVWPALSRLWSRIRGVRPSPEAKLPAGLRIYAIGDIHGFSDLLAALTRKIEADLARDRPNEAHVVFVGDYIDRGPDSAGVVARLARADYPVPFTALRGNHEDMMMRALADPGAMGHWCQSGGIETLASYGVVVERRGRKSLAKARRALIEHLPPDHLAFLHSTALSRVAGDYFFAHAGAKPGVPLDRQAPDDLMWIRDEFHGSSFDFGKVVVHGHTPHPAPEDEPRRINVDTGAFKWGVLTCAVLEGSQRRFISTQD